MRYVFINIFLIFIFDFQIDWEDNKGWCYQDQVYGCYVEGDYGYYYLFIFFLEYVQVCDFYEDFQFVDKGYVIVKVFDGY